MAFSATDQFKSNAALGLNRLNLAVFVITLFVSAFLLFSIQPFFAKMVLPKLGGSPAVWSVAMVFFQGMLLAGYLYAHLLSTYFSPRVSALVHITIIGAALIFMPIAIPASWGNPPETGQPVWLLGLFTASVGLPFFAVAANGPLLQSWFSKSGHPHASDPYFLYSASNLGSFASLFLFIVLIEPNFSVPEISTGWMAGFIALGFMILVCSIFANIGATVAGKNIAPVKPAHVSNITPIQLAKWIGLSFVPSGLLVAVTAFISTDIAAVPFLWIVPLSLFLLTFILAFAQKRIFSIEFLSKATAILAIAVLCFIPLGHQIPVAAKLTLHIAFFLIAALLCHSVLVDQRPSSGKLTSFYLWMSFGGVLGGAFASLLAPVIFTSIAEYPILVILSLFCRPSAWKGDVLRLFITAGSAAFIGLVLLNPSLADSSFMQNKAMLVSLFLSFAGLSWFYLFRNETWFIGQAILALSFMLGIMNAQKVMSADRSFFGVVSVYQSPDQKYVLMAHGSTLHGAMAKAAPGQKPEPLTYYHRTGGIAASLFAAQQKWALSPLGRNANVGIVGLGAGSLLCHRKPGERWTSYEIDKAVVTAASDPKLFRFVSDCGMNDPIIIGDGRLKLAEEPNAKFDYLLIDAFSSDSIPVHLLTNEAFQLYFSKLTNDGVLTVHISNRYLELASIIQAIAQRNGYVGRFGTFEASPEQAAMKISTNVVVVLAKNNSALGSIADSSKWAPLPDLGTKPWTDDYSDMIGALVRGSYK